MTPYEKQQAYLKRYGKDDESIAAYQKEYRKTYMTGLTKQANGIILAGRQVALVRDLPFSITINWVKRALEFNICQLTGLPFKDHPAFTPVLSRIDPKIGFEPGNTRLVLRCVHRLTCDQMTDKQLLKVAERLAGGLMKLK